ncbi:hypothetical protein Pan44_33030 [Caulifigura coniformis]|uniref:Carboxypeptidase regulatory-like domain-containing protein n=1 Tax=Caulifigura coniformis TaxID=2527983 RepID=A0A517SGM3_9PLAN|nr:hypothetical protein [Caulifigura coniformis]QDT55260.1 hypothetical protein Pan44_33030 [Caulifigura coniformis]
MRLNGAVSLLVTSVLVSQFLGCGSSGPELASVTGVITLDGKPLPKVGVVFRPLGSGASPAYGGTNRDGKYTLMFSRDSAGAMPGDYEVDLEVTKYTKSEIEQMKADGNEPPPPVTLPKQYRQPGALKATVKSGVNTIDFALESK